MSLRWRWALGMTLVAALAIGLTAGAAFLSAQSEFRGSVDEDLRERAAVVNRWTRDSVDTDGEGDQRADRPLTAVVDYDATVQAFDEDGEVIFRVGPEEGTGPPVEEADLAVFADGGGPVLRYVRIGDHSYRMITTRIAGGGMAFQIATDLSGVDDNLGGLARRLLAIGLIGVLLVGVTGWTLASRAVRPITDLTAAAEQVAATERLDAGGRLDTSAPGEIGRLAGAFSLMLDSLSDSRREQQRLVSDAGHEFRTPITALTTNLEILHRQGDGLPSEQRDTLIEAALAESGQLADLTSELVDLASDVRHSGEQVHDVDLGMLASEIAHRYSRLGRKSVTVSGEGGVVKARRSQLERALGNLVDNAVKWSVSRVDVGLDGGRVSVRDDGRGIPGADLPHVFGRFYRSDEARSTPGSGLGLAIVEHLIRAHGGTVFARNHSGGGAEVGFVLPLARPNEGGGLRGAAAGR